MLHSRLRPLPRLPTTTSTSTSTTTSTAPPPTFDDNDTNNTDYDYEDLFTSFLPHLFPDDAPSFHGDPGQRLLYESPRYGPLTIMVPSYPGESEKPNDEVAAGTTGSSVEERRKLFAHFLWSAAMVVAEGIEDADAHDALGDVDGDKRMWKVKGKSVLELGAGAALPSLIAALAHASTVTITDHPFSPAFTSAIPFNITNIPPNNQCKIDIHPHEWGTLSTDPWTTAHKNTYTRIIAADCFWMRSQHANLVRTMRWFLAPGGRVWVVAGFHTGRAVVAGFFEEAVAGGFTVEKIYERDLNAEGVNGGEVRRRWMVEREGVENRKRWCVVAVLARTGTEPDT